MEDYQIVELIAQGGYGIVLKALQKSTGQLVAIKQFRDSDPLTQKIAQREISVLKLMNGHPNIIQLLNSFQHNQKVFLVFEIMQQTLLEHVQKQPEGKLDREQVRLLVFQMVQALHHMHSQNAVHRDIKPENMLIQCIDDQSQNKISNRRGSSVNPKANGTQTQEDGVFILKVCDFGQSKQVNHQDVTLTEYVSTRWYRAPELLVGSKVYDKSIDIWALGCMVPELISGKPLFPGNTNYEALAYVLKTLGNNLTEQQIEAFQNNPQFEKYGKIKKVIPLKRRVPELTDEEVDFVEKCLQFNPNQRYSAFDLLNHQYLIQFKDQQYIHQNQKANIQEQDQNKENISQIISEESENIKESSDSEANMLKQSCNQSDSNQQDIAMDLKMTKKRSKRRDSNYSRGKKGKKRPTSQCQNNPSNSSGGQNSQQQNREKVLDKNQPVEQSKNSNGESSNSNRNSGHNQKRKDTQNNKEEQVDNQNSTPLPKPILFLRKQKDAMQQNVEKESHKGFNKLGLPEEVLMNTKEELIIDNPQNTFQNQNPYSNNDNRISELDIKSSSTTIHKQTMYNHSYAKKPNHHQNQGQKNNYKEQSFNKGSHNQLMQIPKNQILFVAQKNNISPPMKVNNQKIEMIMQNQNSNQQLQVQYKGTIPQKYQKRPSIQQNQPRNISMPPHQQQQQQILQNQEEIPVKKLQNKMFLAYNQEKVQSYSPNSYQSSIKKDYLPKLIKERRLEEKLKAQNMQLLNTQKHETNKLQLPAISKNSSIKHEKDQKLMFSKKVIGKDNQLEKDRSLNSFSRVSSNNDYIQQQSSNFLRMTSHNQERTMSNFSASPHQIVDRQRITQQFPSSIKKQLDTYETQTTQAYFHDKSPMSSNISKNLFTSKKSILQASGTNYPTSLNGRLNSNQKK